MTYDSLVAALQDRDVMVPLICSLVAGGLIGAEREFNRKPAGIRTHALLCFASALMTLVGLRMNEWVAHLPEGLQAASDLARIPHAILTGVGFIGAGVIVRDGGSVKGLTTATALWLTAALGVVFGTGLMAFGMIGATIAVIVLAVLRLFQRFDPPAPFGLLELELSPDSTLTATTLKEKLAEKSILCGMIGYSMNSESGMRRYDTLITLCDSSISPEEIAATVSGAGGVRQLKITPVLTEPG